MEGWSDIRIFIYRHKKRKMAREGGPLLGWNNTDFKISMVYPSSISGWEGEVRITAIRPGLVQGQIFVHNPPAMAGTKNSLLWDSGTINYQILLNSSFQQNFEF